MHIGKINSEIFFFFPMQIQQIMLIIQIKYEIITYTGNDHIEINSIIGYIIQINPIAINCSISNQCIFFFFQLIIVFSQQNKLF